jgi:OOP family OmpA-OmpF porin
MQPLIRLNLTLLIFYAGQSLAANPSYPVVDGNAGYLQDARGSAVISTNGNCWHTGGWRPVLATVVGCDGVVAKTSAVSAPQIPAPQAPPTQVAPSIAKAPAAPAPPIETVVEKITLDTDAYFDFDKALLKKGGEDSLKLLANRLLGMSIKVIVATGHTDAIGAQAYNQKLSERRAAAVKSYLLSQSLPADRIYTQGKGESEPIASNNNSKGRSENRRVDIEVVSTRQQVGHKD